MGRQCVTVTPFCEVCDRPVDPMMLTLDGPPPADLAPLEASALKLHMSTAHRDHCPHGMPSKSSCVECMDEAGVADPSLDPTGRPERADSRPIVGRYDKDCPVCGFTMLGKRIVHTTSNRWAHEPCVDGR